MQPYGLEAAALCAWAAAVCAQAAISCGRGYGLHRVATRISAGVLDGATHVYMANLCFPEALNHAMTTALAAVSPPRGGGPLPPPRGPATHACQRLPLYASEAATLRVGGRTPYALYQVASLRCVLTLRDLPLREAWPTDAKACRGRRLERVAEVSVGMSWADNVGVSYYCCSGDRQ